MCHCFKQLQPEREYKHTDRLVYGEYEPRRDHDYKALRRRDAGLLHRVHPQKPDVDDEIKAHREKGGIFYRLGFFAAAEPFEQYGKKRDAGKKRERVKLRENKRHGTQQPGGDDK